MSYRIDDNKIKIFSALVTSLVEGNSLKDCFDEVDLSRSKFADYMLASQSSQSASRYVNELLDQQAKQFSRQPEDQLYLIKKIWCNPEDSAKVVEAVSDADNDKFKVLRVIGYDPLTIRYKQSNTGIEYHLVADYTEMEALRATTDGDPLFYRTEDPFFSASELQHTDEIVTKAVYEHTSEAMGKLFGLFR